jgi:hypothetical protein
MSLTPLERRLRWAGVLISLGLVVEWLTLRRVHPLMFVAFLFVACPLIAVGTLVFLVSILKGEGGHATGPSRGGEPPG